MFNKLVIAVAILAAVATGVVKRGTFSGRAWSIEVPAEYVNEPSATPDGRTKIVAFTPDPRDDGTRPLVQLTLRDLSDLPKPPPLEAFAAALIESVQRRREEWAVEKTKVDVSGRAMVRYAWSGVAIPAPDGAAERVRARGVMLVGIDGRVGFALSTQDVDAHAADSLPRCERALRTFRIN
jgi:hypothetical protein